MRQMLASSLVIKLLESEKRSWASAGKNRVAIRNRIAVEAACSAGSTSAAALEARVKCTLGRKYEKRGVLAAK